MSEAAWGNSFAGLLRTEKPRQERSHPSQAEFKLREEQPILFTDLIPEYEDEKGTLCKWSEWKNGEPSNLEAKNIELVSYLGKDENGIDEKSILGIILRQRAVIFDANSSLIDGWHLWQQQDDIPVEMRGKRIVLPGTLLKDSVGSINVACLEWCKFDSRWRLGFHWFDWLWDASSCLVRSKSKQSLGSL